MLLKLLKSFLTVFFCYIVFHNVSAQENKSFDALSEDISQILPPLNVLIDSALLNDPFVHFRDLQLIINKIKIKSERIGWTRNLGIQADVSAGTFDNLSTNTADGQSSSNLLTRTSQTTYGFGAYVKFPVFDFIGRKNEIRLAKAEFEQAESMVEVQRKEVRKIVIVQYNDLILKQRLLKIKAKYLASAQINFEMAQKEFQNGVVDVGEFSRISDISSRAEVDFESARTDFITAYLVLEEIVGFNFNQKNEL